MPIPIAAKGEYDLSCLAMSSLCPSASVRYPAISNWGANPLHASLMGSLVYAAVSWLEVANLSTEGHAILQQPFIVCFIHSPARGPVS
jgi:hypothetical protein